MPQPYPGGGADLPSPRDRPRQRHREESPRWGARRSRDGHATRNGRPRREEAPARTEPHHRWAAVASPTAGDRRPGRERARRRKHAAGQVSNGAIPLLVRGSLMIGLIGVLALSIALSGGVGGDGDVRFSAGSPPTTEDISPAGSAEKAMERRGGETASRSRAEASAAVPTPATTDVPAPQPPCHIMYSVASERGNRFTVAIVIANTSARAVDGWTLRWDFPPKQKIIYGWNATVTNGPDGGAATDIASDRIIPVGGEVTIGFVGTSDAWIPTPTGFTLNGTLCQWQPARSAIALPSAVTVAPTPSAPAVPSSVPEVAPPSESPPSESLTSEAASASGGSAQPGATTTPSP